MPVYGLDHKQLLKVLKELKEMLGRKEQRELKVGVVVQELKEHKVVLVLKEQ